MSAYNLVTGHIGEGKYEMKVDLSQGALTTASTWKLPAGVQFGFVSISQDLVLRGNSTGGL